MNSYPCLIKKHVLYRNSVQSQSNIFIKNQKHTNVPKFGTKRRSSMKTIVVGNLKGGVGKTTVTVNLAYSLSILGNKVLVIDLDPQCNCTRYFAKVSQSGYTVQDLLHVPERINQVIYRTKYQKIDVIRGDAELTCCDQSSLSKAFQKLKKVYDYCIIDTRPVFDVLTQNAVEVADLLLTPIKFDNYCRDNLALVEHVYENFIENTDHFKWKICANMVANTKAQRSTMQDLLEKHMYPILDTCISRSAVVDNALLQYKPVLRHRKHSTVAEDFLELAKELIAEWR